jgi:hypothetical protein
MKCMTCCYCFYDLFIFFDLIEQRASRAGCQSINSDGLLFLLENKTDLSLVNLTNLCRVKAVLQCYIVKAGSAAFTKKCRYISKHVQDPAELFGKCSKLIRMRQFHL